VRPRPIPTLAALSTAAALTGCGITNPYQHVAATPTSPSATSQAADTTAANPASPTDTDQTSQSAGAVLRRYTLLSINWTSTTLARQQRQLAAMAIAGARVQALQTAASYGVHSTLQRSGVSNHGQITSIAPGTGPRHAQWIITTQERTAGRGDYTGLPMQAHVYYAQLTRTTHGWQVSQWSPQN
jgi:hypothetical protein